MAKVAKMPGTLPTSVPLIVEDPRPSKNNMYLYGVKHDKNSLTPYFNKTLKNYLSVTNQQAQNTSTHYSNTKLHLNKLTTHIQDYYNTTNNPSSYSYNWPDESPWFYMDETKESGVIKTITDSTNSATTYAFSEYNQQYHYQSTLNGDITSEGEWEDLTFGQWDTDSAYYANQGFPIKAGGGRVYGIHAYSSTTTTGWDFDPNYYWFYKGSSWPSSTPSFSYSTSYSINSLTDGWTPQYLGDSSIDGAMMIVQTYASTSTNSARVYISKNVPGGGSVPVSTILLTSPSGVLPAAGTHAGGYFMNNKALRKNCSHTFTDPRDSNKKAFYYPYFDSYGDFHPFVGTWDTTTDEMALESDISITGDKSSVHASFLSEATYGYGDGITAATWVSGGTRYVTYIPFDMAQYGSGSRDAFKTLITYSVDPANPKNLTYHSKLILATPPRNHVWLNDSRTMLGLFMKDTFQVIAWNAATGWAVATTIMERVSACGRDSLDRIWYSTNNTDISASYQDLNLLSPTLPVTVTISPESTDNQYAGSVIDTYIDVSAYNTAGSRIATSVKLVIDSASVTFADGTKTKTVTTLASGELQVAIKINGAGYSNITASIQV